MNDDPLEDDSDEEKGCNADERAWAVGLVSRAKRQESLDARKILNENPRLGDYPSLVVDLAFEEYCRKQESGEEIGQRCFASRFPGFEDSLLKTLQVHHYLAKGKAGQKELCIQWPVPGDIYGEYRLIEYMGRGAFAVVFIAEQMSVADRKVVLKLTRDAVDEVESLSQLDHPNIVQIFTVHRNPDGLTAICMPLISRVTLFDLLKALHATGVQPETGEQVLEALKRCQPPWGFLAGSPEAEFLRNQHKFMDLVIRVGIDLARALSYSHDRGILHCDVKPTNILIRPNGRSMLFDFNLSSHSNSKSGRIAGTLCYMPPEQLQAFVDSEEQFAPTSRTDLYSLGVTLYQLLTGRLPWGDVADADTQEEATRVLLERQKEMRLSFQGVPELNPRLRRVICQCLSFDPVDRPSSARQIAADLESEFAVSKRFQRWIIRNLIGCLFGFCFLLILVSILVLALKTPETLPEQAVGNLLERGKTAERNFDFDLANVRYQKAVNRAAEMPRLHFEALCRQAIVQSRMGEEKGAMEILDRLKKIYPEGEILIARIELALRLSCVTVSHDSAIAAQQAREQLVNANRYSLDDECNYWTLRYRVLPKPRDDLAVNEIVSELKRLLDREPDHVIANSTLFRIQSSLGVNDYDRLLGCLDACGDRPELLLPLFEKVAGEINANQMDENELIALLPRYAVCGGRKPSLDGIIWTIRDEEKREKVITALESTRFKDHDHDLFRTRGTVNPLNSFDLNETKKRLPIRKK